MGSLQFTVIGKLCSDAVEGRKFMIREFQFSVKDTQNGKFHGHENVIMLDAWSPQIRPKRPVASFAG